MAKKLLTTCDFLDLMKVKLSATSDYQLANAIGWTRSAISTYRTRPQYFGDAHAIEAAKICGFPSGFVLCCVHAERAKDKGVKKHWRDMACAKYMDGTG